MRTLHPPVLLPNAPLAQSRYFSTLGPSELSFTLNVHEMYPSLSESECAQEIATISHFRSVAYSLAASVASAFEPRAHPEHPPPRALMPTTPSNPRIATTIKNSTSVKPLEQLNLCILTLCITLYLQSCGDRGKSFTQNPFFVNGDYFAVLDYVGFSDVLENQNQFVGYEAHGDRTLVVLEQQVRRRVFSLQVFF